MCRIDELLRRISEDLVAGGCGFDDNDGMDNADKDDTTSLCSDFNFCLVLGSMFVFISLKIGLLVEQTRGYENAKNFLL